MPRPRWRWGAAPTFAALAALLSLALYWYHPLPLERLDTRTRDLVFALRQPPAATAPVVVVAVDEAAVRELGRWPWSRHTQTRLMERLKAAGADTLALDIVYRHTEDAAADARLAAALARPGAAVVGGFFFRGERTFEGEAQGLDLLHRSRVQLLREAPGALRERLPAFPQVETNQPELAASMDRLGFFNYVPDPDGLLRTSPLLARHAGEVYPSLALAALAQFMREDVAVDLGPHGVEAIRIGRAPVPSDEWGRFSLDFYNGEQRLPMYSAADVVAGRIGEAELGGRLVFVGVTETGIADVRPSPVDPSFPGVLAQATLAANVLQGDFLYRDGRTVLVDVLAMALVPLLVAGLMARLRNPLLASAAALAVAGLLGWAFFLLVARAGWLVSLAYPLMALVGTFVLYQSYAVLVEQRQTRFLKKAFSAYVSPALVNRLLENPDALGLGGERRELTVLFSDVRSFTTLAEGLTPERLVAVLNRYLEPMTRIVMEEQGTLDKYIGDAVMALFNAPLPVPDHPQRAAEAALRMQEELVALNRGFAADFGLELAVGIGIHCGEAVVGNIGGTRRFEYTAMGDSVNLASRLEGLSKVYGVPIVLSGELADRLPAERFVCRQLDRIRVKGKQQAVEVYELMGRQGDARLVVRRDAFEAALREYFNGCFDAAADGFERLCREFPEDAPSRLFLERCRAFAAEHPGGGWDGVSVAAGK